MKEVIVITDHELSPEERKNYSKEHPGRRLCFRLRYPDFPLYLQGTATAISVAVLIWTLLMK